MELAGKKVLVVEDEAIIAFAIEDMLGELGCEVIGPAMHLDEAESLAANAVIDAAILDVNINDGRSYKVAETLEERRIPFTFASGYDEAGLQWRGAPAELLAKPYRKDQIRAALERMLDGP